MYHPVAGEFVGDTRARASEPFRQVTPLHAWGRGGGLELAYMSSFVYAHEANVEGVLWSPL